MKRRYAPNSNFIGIMNLHVLGSPSAHHQEFLAIHQHWCVFADLMTICYLEQDGTVSGSRQSSNLQKCTNADVQLRTPDYGQKGSPKHVQP